MAISNTRSGTNVVEIADGIYRINTPVTLEDAGGFSFNQYLVVDDEPMLFHTGPRRMFALVREAVASVLPVERLRYIGLSHVEADGCGSLNEWLAVAASPFALATGEAAGAECMLRIARHRCGAQHRGEQLELWQTDAEAFAPQ